MPRLVKYFEPGLPFLVTSRTEEGLPFRTTKDFNTLFYSILARAQKLYPVHVCAFCLMPNHFHMMLVPINPEVTPLFVGYVKQELAHAVNRLLGRRKHTIWCEGYDSPALLGEDEVLEYLCYIYTQAQKANLVNSIEQYPGASSWEMFSGSKRQLSFPLSNRISPLQFDKDKKVELTLNPFAWTKLLRVQKSETELKDEVIHIVRAKETELAALRREKGQVVMGAKKLQARQINTTYQPKEYGRKMLCLCRNLHFRKAFISFYQYLRRRAQRILRLWKKGGQYLPWPPGLFPPRFPKFTKPKTGRAWKVAELCC